jgi:hypothetical protein
MQVPLNHHRYIMRNNSKHVCLINVNVDAREQPNVVSWHIAHLNVNQKACSGAPLKVKFELRMNLVKTSAKRTATRDL